MAIKRSYIKVGPEKKESADFTLQHGTTSEWASYPYPLEKGELGWDETTNEVKIGDGVTLFPSLTSVGGGVGSVDWSVITGKPTTFTPSSHTHPQSDITNLVTDLSGKQATLVSGTNIKTINGSSLLGSGDLVVSGGTSYNYGQLSADYTLTSQTASQKLFNFSTNGALTLATGRYIFRTMFYVQNMSSAASNNAQFLLLGAGTASIANVFFHAIGLDNNTGITTGARGGSASLTESGPAAMVTAGTGTQLMAEITGIFNITSTGTIIPSIALATAAAAVVKAGSFFECIRIGDTGSNTLGTWT